MIKLPSIKQLTEGFTKTCLRFPFAVVYAFMGTFTAIYLVDSHRDDDNVAKILYKIILSAALGVLSATAITLITERLKKGTQGYIVASIFKVITPIAYYFSLPDELNTRSTIKYMIIMLALHLIVSYAPFIWKGTINGFWQFNKSLFINFLVSILYSSVLYLGLIAALGTVDELFNVNLDYKIYLKLYIFMAGIFNTIFFLASVPEYFTELDNETDYPKGLKIFTQFVLLPLVIIYLIILYVYEAKIIFTNTMPAGIVSYLVIGFAVFGILALLLVYPIQEKIGNQWIKRFSTSFYIALFPLIGLLFWAIGLRVMQYGFTEKRYFILALACWLTFVSFYYLLNKSKNIKIIPVSLSLLMLLSIYGPWSAFEISMFSQQSILVDLLKKNKIYNGQKITKTNVKITENDETQIGRIVDYLCTNHGVKSLAYVLGSQIDSVANVKPESSYAQTNFVLKKLGLKYPNYSYNPDVKKYFTYSAPQANVMTIPYQSVIKYSGSDYLNEYQIALDNKLYLLKVDVDKYTFNITQGKDTLVKQDLSTLLLKIAKENSTNVTKNNYEIINEQNGLSYKLVFQKVSTYYDLEQNTLESSNFEFYLLLNPVKK